MDKKNTIKLKLWQIIAIGLVIFILIVIMISYYKKTINNASKKIIYDITHEDNKEIKNDNKNNMLIDIVFTPVENQNIEYISHLSSKVNYMVYTWGGNFHFINDYNEETNSYYDIEDFIKKVENDATNDICKFEKSEDIYTAYYYKDYSILLCRINDNTYNVVITRNNKDFDVIEEYKKITIFKAQIKDNYTIRGLFSNVEAFQKNLKIYNGLSGLNDDIFKSKSKLELKIGDIVEVRFSGQINDNSLFDIYKIEYINDKNLINNTVVKKKVDKLNGKFIKKDDSSYFVFYSNGKFINAENNYFQGTYTIENNILKCKYNPTNYDELQGELQLKIIDETQIINEYTNEIYNYIEFEDNHYNIFGNTDAGVISSIAFKNDNTFVMYEIYEEYIGTYFKQEDKIICNINEYIEIFDGPYGYSNKIPVQITVVFEEESENFIKLIDISTNEYVTLINSLNKEYCISH